MPAQWRLWLHPQLQRLRNLPSILAYSLVSLVCPIRPNSVIFVTNRLGVLTDNLKFVYDSLDKNQYAVTEVCLPTRTASGWTRLIHNLRFVVAMAQTQYVLVDDFLPVLYPLRLRRGTRLVQVWHALGALKRVGYSRQGRGGGPPSTSMSHKNYTDVIVSAESIRKDFAEAFSVPLQTVHATGAPRSDLFFDADEQDRILEPLYDAVPQLKGKRVILFAPTFRGGQKRGAHYPAKFIDLDRFGAALGDHDLLVIKMHPFITDPLPIPPAYADKIIDLSSYHEFNHLLLVADVLVTDYSSAIFDYALLGRPVVFYVPDLDDYTRHRGFYYDFDEYAYGPLARTFPELLSALRDPQVDEARLRQFHDKFLDRCDGHATQRFIDLIFHQGPPIAVDVDHWNSDS
ncbi:MAG: CDP-glycerol glycerophosphotransferase family protein [Propionibacteriaceae bacterium]|nr:CDP-glycerol glycerophosphotransferase family protein [Propionibacteriaceae bacterium]